ncbi:cytochrome P450 [Kitasatospora kifunensis]|uniref:Cytochrome P450 n=1 Tax=Kitasatospora kifunensis TaxID=58351 RepID=A0A7W7VYK6_KITKI|nr:cytochrome P450 [Kitasatospora kifunensis]MBB4927148.1 cytochrome P450 [Kitasatospora kifunensis]
MTVDEVFNPDTYTVGVPYERLRALRATAAVCRIGEPAVGEWAAGPGYWAVLRHAEVKQVLRSPEDFSSFSGGTQLRDPDSPADLAFQRTMMLNQDPPAHGELRRLVAAAFTPRAVRELTAVIEERARELVAGVAARGAVDYVALAADLPVRTLAHLLGVPEQDRGLLVDWSNRVIGYQDAEYAHAAGADRAALSPIGRAALAHRPAELRGPDGRPVSPRSKAALADMFAYAHALAEHPAPGSVLARMRDGGLVGDAFETMFFLFAIAGNETLRNAIPGALHTLLQHPEQYRLLCERPELTDSAVEEMLRYWPPVMNFRRTATREIELGGQRIGAGDKVVVYYVSANRDERVFADPDRFDLTRTPNEHLSFGFGPHVCLGARLARLQMRALLRETVLRLPELTPDGPAVRLVSNFQNGLKRLPVRWRVQPEPLIAGRS